MLHMQPPKGASGSHKKIGPILCSDSAIASESLQSPTISSTIELSADEKRVRLFNVGDPFEISMAEFDEHWRPLVSNVWIERRRTVISAASPSTPSPARAKRG